MFTDTLIKVVVIIILFCIIVSLGFAVKALVQNKDCGKSLLKFLSLRIGLSLFVFSILLFCYYGGFLQPHPLVI